MATGYLVYASEQRLLSAEFDNDDHHSVAAMVATVVDTAQRSAV